MERTTSSGWWVAVLMGAIALGSAGACSGDDAMGGPVDAGGDAGGAPDAAPDGGGDGGAASDSGADVGAPPGDASAGDGGAPDTGAGGGSDGGTLTAAPGTLVFEGEVDGVAFSATCTPDAAFLSPTQLSVAFAGQNLNVKCPSASAVGIENPNFVVAFVRFDDTATSFSYGPSDVNPTDTTPGFNVSAGAGPGRALHGTSDYATALSVSATFDTGTRTLEGTFSGTWEGAPDSELGEGNGWVEAAYNVTVP